MNISQTQVPRTNADRRPGASAAAGVTPSQFGRRKPAQPHRDRKQATARGERQHTRPRG